MWHCRNWTARYCLLLTNEVKRTVPKTAGSYRKQLGRNRRDTSVSDVLEKL